MNKACKCQKCGRVAITGTIQSQGTHFINCYDCGIYRVEKEGAP